MSRLARLRPHIQEYRVPGLTVLVALGIALWPGILGPLAQAYVRLCDYTSCGTYRRIYITTHPTSSPWFFRRWRY